MADPPDTLELRYVGSRFSGGRMPLDVLPDLSAFRDLIIAVAKARWLSAHAGRQRLPRGFNHSVSFDLIEIKSASAGPMIQWDRQLATKNAPDLADEIGALIGQSYADAADLFNGVVVDRFPPALPAEQVAALNKFGSSLQPGEKIEFTSRKDAQGEVIFLDAERRKRLLTRIGETYTKRVTGSGALIASSSDGWIEVDTREFGRINITVPSAIVVEHYDGNMGAEVQYDLMIGLDSAERFRGVVECLDVTVVDASDAQEFRDAMARINDLRSLGAGWLDGVGKITSQSAVVSARMLLDRRPDLVEHKLRIFPTEDGGLTFEFTKDGWEYGIEFLPSGSVELFGVEIEGAKSLEPLSFVKVDAGFLSDLAGRIGRSSADV